MSLPIAATILLSRLCPSEHSANSAYFAVPATPANHHPSGHQFIQLKHRIQKTHVRRVTNKNHQARHGRNRIGILYGLTTIGVG